MVCKPKTLGGLQILNLGTQNEALLMKNKFFNKHNISCVNLIWDNYYYGMIPTEKKVDSF